MNDRSVDLTAADRDKIITVLKVRAQDLRSHCLKLSRVARPSELAMMRAEATWLETICEKLFLVQHVNFNEWSEKNGDDLS